MSSVAMISRAQDHKWAFGFYGDVQLESPGYAGSFGVQGKYDVTNRSALQATVNGRNGYVAVGADYLLSLLDKKKSNFNVFLGAGISQDFYRYNELLVDPELPYSGEKPTVFPEEKQNYTVANGQVGVSYYFPAIQLSVYTGYKVKYNFKFEETDPNFLMFGVRYHLW